MGLTVSEECSDILRTFDVCLTKTNGNAIAYKNLDGIWCIGYGWNGTIHGKPVTEDTEITKSTVELLFRKRVAICEKKVNKYYSQYHWNQNQFDALVRFCWDNRDLDELLANGTRKINEISDAMLSFTDGYQRFLNDTITKRQLEKELFDKPYTSKQKPVVKRVDIMGERINCYEQPIASSRLIGKIGNRTKVNILEDDPGNSYYKIQGVSVTGVRITGYCEKRYFRE